MVLAINRTFIAPCADTHHCDLLAIRQDLSIESTKSTQNYQRTLRVQLPPSYFSQPHRKYPLLLMQDGQNLFEKETSFMGKCWDLGAKILNGICHQQLNEFIVVGIDNSGLNRAYEYTPWQDQSLEQGGGADEYLDWIEHTVLPSLNDRYRITKDPSQHIIGGSSLGALVSLYALTKKSHLFGGAILMSGSWWWENNSIHDYIKNNWRPSSSVKVWLDTGNAEPGQYGTHAMRETLRSIGLSEENNSLRYMEADGGKHSEYSWKTRVHLPLRYFFASDY